MLANNLANSNTSGFKLDREFYSLFSGDAGGVSGEEPAQVPDIKSQWTDFSQATLTPTKNPLDLALTGPGFFVVNGPSGPLYTRNGAFQLSSSGVITTSEGYPVLGAGGQQIQAQPQGDIVVEPDGTVQQGEETIGQLQIATFDDPAGARLKGAIAIS